MAVRTQSQFGRFRYFVAFWRWVGIMFFYDRHLRREARREQLPETSRASHYS